MFGHVWDPTFIDPALDSRAVTFENLSGERGAGGAAAGGRKGAPSRRLKSKPTARSNVPRSSRSATNSTPHTHNSHGHNNLPISGDSQPRKIPPRCTRIDQVFSSDGLIGCGGVA